MVRLLEGGADVNIVSQMQRIPLDELDLHHDKKHARERIRRRLRKKSPETLYSVLLTRGGRGSSDRQDWFHRMFYTCKNPYTGKVFLTVVKAAEMLHLVAMQQANQWIERSIVQCMDYGSKTDDNQVLNAIAEYAACRNMVGSGLVQVLRQFCREKNHSLHNENSDNTRDWNLRVSIQKEIEKSRKLTCVDGTTDSIKQYLKFFVRAMHDVALNRDHTTCGTSQDDGSASDVQVKLNVLRAMFGVLLNTILRGGDKFFDHFTSEIINLVDYEHLTLAMEQGDSLGHNRSNIKSLQYGYESSKRVLDNGVSAISSSIGDGFVLFGLCCGLLKNCTIVLDHGAREPTAITNTTTTFKHSNDDAVVKAVPQEEQVDHKVAERLGANQNVVEARLSVETTTGTEAIAVSRARDRTTTAENQQIRPSVPNLPRTSDNMSQSNHSLTSYPSTIGSRTPSRSTAPSTNTFPSATPTNAPSTLHWAVVGGDKGRVVEELERASASGTLHELDAQGRSALDLAALAGQREIHMLIEKAGGHRVRFKTDSEMRAVLEYCSMDPEANRHGLWRSYFGSSRGSLSSRRSISTSSTLSSIAAGGKSIGSRSKSSRVRFG